VPKHEILNPPGTPIDDELRKLLKQLFSAHDIERMERLGGRILISLTAPYVTKAKREASKKLIIDQKFMDDLSSLKSDPEGLNRVLENLSEAQLRALCRRLGVPVGSKNTSMELRAQLVRSLEAEDFWRRISGSATLTDRVEGRKGSA
jgi:hypothetical protein